MSKGVQQKEEPTQGKVDEGVSQACRQGADGGPVLRVREAPQRSDQVRPRAVDKDSRCHQANKRDQGAPRETLCYGASPQGHTARNPQRRPRRSEEHFPHPSARRHPEEGGPAKQDYGGGGGRDRVHGRQGDGEEAVVRYHGA